MKKRTAKEKRPRNCLHLRLQVPALEIMNTLNDCIQQHWENHPTLPLLLMRAFANVPFFYLFFQHNMIHPDGNKKQQGLSHKKKLVLCIRLLTLIIGMNHDIKRETHNIASYMDSTLPSVRD